MQHIILIGFKHVGKSVIGAALAQQLKKPFIDLDRAIEKHYAAQYDPPLSCREMMHKHGEDFFRAQEEKVLLEVLQSSVAVIALGGGTPLTENNQKHIEPHRVILIEAEPERVWERIAAQGLPAYFSQEEAPLTQFHNLWQARKKIYHQLTQQIITNNDSVDQAVSALLDLFNNAPTRRVFYTMLYNNANEECS